MNFSQRLTALLEERGWTQYRLAKNMDISQSTVSHWLNGDGTPQKHTHIAQNDIKRYQDAMGAFYSGKI